MTIEAEQLLQKSFNEITMMMDNLPIQIWFLTDVGTYGRVNKSHADFHGVDKHMMEFKKIRECIPSNRANAYVASNQEVFETKKTVYIERRIPNANGEERLLAITKSPKFAQNGRDIDYIICFAIDITERKETENALLNEHRHLSSIIQGTNLGTWEWNIQTGETTFNDRWAEIIGYTLDELHPVSIKTWEKLTHPDDLKKSYELIMRHISGEVPFYDCECRMKHKDGHWIWVHDRGKIMTFDENGKPLMMYGTHTDITMRKQTEKELQSHKNRLNTILSISNSFISIAPPDVNSTIQQTLMRIGNFEGVDRAYVFLFDDNSNKLMSNTHEWCAEGVNPQIKNLQNLSAEEYPWMMHKLLKNECIEIADVHDMPPEAKNEQTSFQSQSIKSLLTVPITLNTHLIGFLGFDSVRENLRWSESSISSIRMVADILANAFEIQKAEQLLSESESNYRTFIETIDDIVLVGTPEGQIIYTNPATRAKLNYTSEELLKMKILDLHPSWVQKEATTILTDMFNGKRDTCPLPLISKNGSLVPVETRVWFGKWSGKDCIFGVCKDLSKEQESLQKFEKLFKMNPSLMAISEIPDRKFIDVNDAFLRTLGYTREDIIGKTGHQLNLFPNPELQNRVAEMLAKYGTFREIEMKVKGKHGELHDGLFSGEIIESQGQKYFLTVMTDITGRKRAEAEREEVIQELKSAIEQIKTLSGIVPICANCKKIRDDKGYWEQVETYVSRHTDARFSHSICPECTKHLYPELNINKDT